MVSRKQLISDLEWFIQDCFNAIKNLNSYQKISQNSERVDGKKYLVVLTECLNCGKEETRLGDQVPEDMEEWF